MDPENIDPVTNETNAASHDLKRSLSYTNILIGSQTTGEVEGRTQEDSLRGGTTGTIFEGKEV